MNKKPIETIYDVESRYNNAVYKIANARYMGATFKQTDAMIAQLVSESNVPQSKVVKDVRHTFRYYFRSASLPRYLIYK